MTREFLVGCYCEAFEAAIAWACAGARFSFNLPLVPEAREEEAEAIDWDSRYMAVAKDRAQRRSRHSQEVEASQARLRDSVSETERLVGESDEMLRQHRQEWEEGDSLPSHS